MKSHLDLAKFDPRRLAALEKENYIAYYQKRWLRLLAVSVAMVKEAYQLSWPIAVYAAYLVARAEMAAAPFPNNDIPAAEGYMRRLSQFLKRKYALDYDPVEAARVEVNWWVVHRRLFAQEENHEVTRALAKSMSVFFGKPEAALMEAARFRAQGILYSDQWVRSGMDVHSPLLKMEEEALFVGYRLLRDSLSAVEIPHS